MSSAPRQSPFPDRAVEAIRRIHALQDERTLREAMAAAAGVIRDSLDAAMVVAWVGDGRGGAPLVGGCGLSEEDARLVASLPGERPATFANVDDHPALAEICVRATSPTTIRHCLHAPLRARGDARGEWAGGIVIGLSRSDASSADLPLALAIAGALGLVVSATCAAESARRDAAGQRLLQRIANLGASLAQPRDVAQIILEEARAAIGADAGVIYLVAGDFLEMAAVSDGDPENTQPYRHIPIAGTVSEQVFGARGARSWIFDEAPVATQQMMATAGARAVASAVITANEAPIGVIHLSRRDDRRFSGDELDLLCGIGAQVGPGLAAALRREETDAELGRRGAALSLLHRLADTLGRTLDLAEVLERCLDFAQELTGADTCTLHLFDEEEQCFELRAWRGLQALSPATKRVPLERSLFRTPDSRREPQVIRADDPRLPATARADFTAAGIAVGISTPLILGERVIGLLGLGFRTLRITASSTLSTLMAIGEQQAVAIDRARVYQVAELRARLAADLRETAERVLTADDDAAIAGALVDAMSRLCGSTMARLATLDGGGHLATAAVRGYSPELLATAERIGSSDPLFRLLEATAGPLVIASPSDLPAGSVAGDHFTSGRVASVVAVALRLGSRTVGLLASPSASPRRFHNEEVAAIGLLASLAASALERRRLHGEAEAERRHLGDLIERLPFPIAVVDHALHFQQTNGAYRSLTGLGDGDALHRLGIARSDGTPVPEGELSAVRALAGEEPDPVERLLGTPQGQRTVQILAVPLRDAEGVVTSSVLAIQDITALRELADAKDRFLAVASHELRSPLASLHACVTLLQIDPSASTDPERRRQLIGRIQGQIGRLSRLVDDLIDTARMRHGTLPVEREPLDLVTVAREAVELAALELTHHHARLDAPEPVHGRWDRHRLAQVAANLISNAVRYSPDGGEIVVTVRRVAAVALLSVRDQGIGIARSQHALLFEPFARGREAGELAPRGLGLGLFITHEIVRRHGGRITVESEPGRGALFTVELPLE